MGEVVKQTRNIFIDSETNTSLDDTLVQVNLIPTDFWCASDENMRMTLTTLELRNNWYNLNTYNTIFYIYTPTGNYYHVTIPQGSYYDFLDTVYNPGVTTPTITTGLATAIQTGLNTSVIGTGHTCTYNPVTRHFTITLSILGSLGTLTTSSYPVCFAVPTGTGGTPPTGVSRIGFFSDTYEILGGVPTKYFKPGDTPLPALESIPAPANFIKFETPFVAQLNSMEAVYVRTNLQTSNYSTYGFSQSIYQNAVTPTNIFARIPLQNQIYNVSDPFIVLEDKNDLFVIEIGNKQLDQLTLYLTDDKNRFLPLVHLGQVTAGMLSFKCSIKWEVVLRDQAAPFIPTIENVRLKLKNLPNQP